MIVVYCPSCGSKLNAKEELIGQTRSCPKCREPVLIQPEAASAASASPATGTVEGGITAIDFGGTLDTFEDHRPNGLSFSNRYFVLGPDRIIASWETGKGWMLNIGSGFAPAKKNAAAIPDQGTFVLVELVFGETPAGKGPIGLRFFKIIKRGALTALYRDESEILNTIECPGSLTKPQKTALMLHFQRTFMQTFFDMTPAIFEFLTDDDVTAHSVGVG
ncbi:MAG TPA: hypothetical protein DEB39_02820 [Planctomycetaceae bacterium]|nr:hypothetical protein [Planctomycetaceae bacterium]